MILSPLPAIAAEPVYIFSCHDTGGYAKIEQAGKRGWLVVTVAIGHDKNNHSGDDFRTYSNRGHGVIVRINNGYSPDGTLPYQSQYADFATRCANYVAATQGADVFIIGNETNLPREWPGNSSGSATEGEPITVARYIDCYNRCYNAIKAVRSTALVCPVPSGTWGPPWPGQGIEGFLDYWVNIINGIGASKIDALILHAYTHGCDPALVTDNSKMNPPYEAIYYNFRVYRNYMNAIPSSMRSKPVYITECDQNTECADGGASPKHTWYNVNNGWVRAIYSEINTWNITAGNQKIRCVTLFRWDDVPEGEWAFGFSNRANVIADWLQAMANEYRWDITPATGSIAGRVKSGGTALSQATVTVSPGAYTALTASDGSCSISAIPVGTYTVTASKTGYATGSQTNVSVASGQTATANFFLQALCTGVPANGAFEDGFTGGIANGWSTWRSPWGSAVQYADSTDIFHGGAHAQRWGRSDNQGVHGGLMRTAAVTAGTTYNLTGWLRFSSTDPNAWIELGCDLTGQIANGEAGTVSYTKYESRGQNTWIEANGSLTATGSLVSIYLKFGHVDVVGGGPCCGWADDITLCAVPTTGFLAGYVRDNSGAALSGATVSTTAGGYTATTGSDGGYFISSVAPGSYSLTASKTGCYPQTQTGQSVVAGQTTQADFSLTPGNPPATPTVTDDGVYQTCLDSIHASWSSYDPTGIAEYQYAVSASSLAVDIIPGGGWQSVGTAMSATRVGLSLSPNVRYYVLAKAKNGIGLWSAVGASDGIRIAQTVGKISDAKKLADGNCVSVNGIICTRWVSGQLIFVQESERTCGIKVTTSLSAFPLLSPGQSCTVAGALASSSDVREISDAVVAAGATGPAPRPLGLGNRMLGGADYFYLPGPPASGQKGAASPFGPNNVGLLVKAWGSVTDAPSGGVFHLSDGSGGPGLRVKLASGVSAPGQGTFAALTGIAEPDGLLLVSNTDIRVFPK